MVILMPDIIQRLRDTYAENPAAALKMLPELFQQYDEGKIVELPCSVQTLTVEKRNCKCCGELFIPLRRNQVYCKNCSPQKAYKRRKSAEAALKEREK